LSAYTVEVVSLALLIFSGAVGLKRIESLIQLSRLNGQLLDAHEKRGEVIKAMPNSRGLIINEISGEALTTEAAAKWTRELPEKIKSLPKRIEKERTKAADLYRWRNRLLLIGLCSLVLSKVLAPYLRTG
jgi:hypothetical protein